MLNRANETITAFGESFYVSRMVSIVRQGAANLVDREIDTVLEIDERRISPKAALDFFPGYDLSGALDEKQEDAERLGLKLEQNASLAQFA